MRAITMFVLLLLFASNVMANERIVVAKDGSGDYTSLQQAIDAVPDSSPATTTIHIKNGVYKERIVVPETKPNIRLVGQSVEGVRITYDNYASKKDSTSKEYGTSGSSSFFVYASDFSAENITFENSSGPVGQAVAMRVTGDRASFINCRFLGFQDTLYTHGDNSRQYYLNCYIEGTVDFVFGAAVCVFDSCTLFGKKGGYFTAASTPGGKRFGYVFRNCKLTGDAPEGSFFLGRPWRPFAKVAFIGCSMDAVVRPAGWDNWGKEANEKTVLYAEYKNTGPGFKPGERVGWSAQLTDAAAAEYTLENIFGDWKPRRQ